MSLIAAEEEFLSLLPLPREDKHRLFDDFIASVVFLANKYQYVFTYLGQHFGEI